MPEEKTVDHSGLEASLDELVKAADATELVKGYGGVRVEHSGRYDEDGKGGGGQAGSGDMGGLDNMMIGKMSDIAGDALVNAGFSADQIMGFMTGKQEDDDDEEDDEDMDGKIVGPSDFEGKIVGPSDFSGRKGKYGKSDDFEDDDDYFTKSIDSLREDSDIGDAIDVSSYLEALTTRVADQMDGIRKSVGRGNRDQRNVNRAFAAAMHQVGSLVKSQQHVISVLGERLGVVERTPNAPKGASDLSGAQAMHKSLTPGGSAQETLSKGEVLNVLTFMNLKKGIKEVAGRSTMETIGLLEGGNVLHPDSLNEVTRFLRTHPQDADAAKRG